MSRGGFEAFNRSIFEKNLKLAAYRHKFWNPKTQQEETRVTRALCIWRFQVWVYDPGIWAWTVEIHVKDSPEIVLLDRRGWFRHNFDWSYHWYIHIGLGKVGISYDEMAYQRYGWQVTLPQVGTLFGCKTASQPEI